MECHFIYQPPVNCDPPIAGANTCIRYVIPDWAELKKEMESKGWKCDKDNEKEIWFSFLEDENHEWMRNYDKNTGRCIQMNGRQRINIRCTNE